MIRVRLLLSVTLIGAVIPALIWSADPPAQPPTIEDRLLKVAKEYEGWGRVDDEARWAPFLCRMPLPGVARLSASKDESTHGRKLYSLFARDRKAYVTSLKSPVDQVIVKEAWVPEEVKEAPAGLESRNPIRGGFHPYASDGKKHYKASKHAGLFIMMKLDPKTPGTDEGWVYATTDAERKKVTAFGKLESCMKCHQEAKNDRLFGLEGHRPNPLQK